MLSVLWSREGVLLKMPPSFSPTSYYNSFLHVFFFQDVCTLPAADNDTPMIIITITLFDVFFTKSDMMIFFLKCLRCYRES